MDFEQIEKLMAKLEASKLKKLVIKQGDFELQLEKEGDIQYVAAPVHHPRSTFGENATESAFNAEVSQKGERGGHHHKPEIDGAFVKAPLVGTFYSSPSPDAPDFVQVGDTVKPGQVLCIIEAMKVMNEIVAESNGVIREILAEKSQPVEFGQNLFRIKYA